MAESIDEMYGRSVSYDNGTKEVYFEPTQSAESLSVSRQFSKPAPADPFSASLVAREESRGGLRQATGMSQGNDNQRLYSGDRPQPRLYHRHADVKAGRRSPQRSRRSHSNRYRRHEGAHRPAPSPPRHTRFHEDSSSGSETNELLRVVLSGTPRGLSAGRRTGRGQFVPRHRSVPKGILKPGGHFHAAGAENQLANFASIMSMGEPGKQRRAEDYIADIMYSEERRTAQEYEHRRHLMLQSARSQPEAMSSSPRYPMSYASTASLHSASGSRMPDIGLL
ncbi:hypothetical protein DIPPA_07104 [Diplonema papillatum]|nr:hypothetical protein DIPPA_07104 [Diplonema papillatum]